MPCHPTVGASKPISVIPARRDGSRDTPRCGSRTAPGRAAAHASGVGCRFGIDVVVVSAGAMRARYCVECAESLGDERTAGRRPQIVQARWEHRDMAPYLRLAVPNYPRRQQYRRLVHAGEAALGGIIAALLGLVISERGSGAARRAAVPHGRRAGLLRSPLALARSSESGRCALGGRRPARAGTAPGGGLAASAFAAVAGSGRHRLGGDRAHRHCRRDRDEDQVVRPAPSRSGARAGGLAVTAPAKMGTQRRAWSLCLVRARGLERVEHDVVVVSIDRLTNVLRVAAGMGPDARSSN